MTTKNSRPRPLSVAFAAEPSGPSTGVSMTIARAFSLAAPGAVWVLVAFGLVGALPQAGFAEGSSDAQQKHVQMTFSGNGAASAINLQYPGTTTGEENVAGNGTLGSFTFRNVTAHVLSPSPQPPVTCSGAAQFYFSRIAGAGIFRFQDGSLLRVELTQGADCIDLVAQEGHCNLTLRITGGTGRFSNAFGTLVYVETARPVLGDALGNPVYFEETGRIAGTVFGVAGGEDDQDERP